MKRTAVLILALILLWGLLPQASAAKIVEQGKLGKDITYTLDDQGLLTISGSGEMDATGACDYKFALKKITKVVIEEGITSVGAWVFRQCEAEKFVIPSTVKAFGDGSFYHCMNVKEFSIPDGVTALPSYCFYWCDSLRSFRVPSTVTEIRTKTFASCAKLETVWIPAETINIWSGSFAGDPKLTAINVDQGNPQYESAGGVLFSAGKRNLYQYPAGKKNKTYRIPDEVTSIFPYAFENCKNLQKVTAPEGLIWIYANAFYGCNALEDFTIPEGVQSIGNYAFSSTSLSSVRIPAATSSIGSSVFAGCGKLAEITVDPANTCFKAPDGVLTDAAGTRVIAFPPADARTSYRVPESVTLIDNFAFFHCTGLSKVILPDSLTEIGEGAFAAVSFSSISLPGSLKTLGDRVFEDCSKLTSIRFPDSVKKIGQFVCLDCHRLKTAVLPLNLKEIEWGTFYRCDALEEVTLPKTVKTIAGTAFICCTALKQVNYPGSEADRKKIKVGEDNEDLEKAHWTYNYRSEPAMLKSFKLNKSKATLKKGKTLQLKVTKIRPAEAEGVKFKWSSSDKSVATVTKNGKVKAKGKGTCVITCEAQDGSGLKRSCKITVK